MKNSILPVLMFTTALLIACSNISPEDYAAVVSENTSLKAEVESLSDENKTLSDKNKELLNNQTTEVLTEYSNVATTAWVNSAFGDDSICLSDVNQQYLQCIASNTYSISDEGISNLWDDLLLSMTTLAYVKDSIPYKIISIKFLDPTGEHILDITLNMDEDSDMMQAIMCNVTHADEIILALQKIVAK